MSTVIRVCTVFSAVLAVKYLSIVWLEQVKTAVEIVNKVSGIEQIDFWEVELGCHKIHGCFNPRVVCDILPQLAGQILTLPFFHSRTVRVSKVEEEVPGIELVGTCQLGMDRNRVEIGVVDVNRSRNNFLVF